MDRFSTVTADDGTTLAVREVGSTTAPVTVVFCHGFCLHSGAWARQRSALSASWTDRARLVFFDHRGHGRSESGPDGTNTIDQLGEDLAAVIRAVAPTGPVVLVGHSMGGMAVLAYVAHHPEAVGSRVVGVALIATAAGAVAQAGIGRLLRMPLVEVLRAVTTVAPASVQTGWELSRRLLAPMIGATLPALPAAPESTAMGYQMIHRTPMLTISQFLTAIKAYDASQALTALTAVPSVVVCGSRDMVTPIQHSRRIAGALPLAELVAVEGGRHMLILDRADVVNASLLRLLDRIARTVAA